MTPPRARSEGWPGIDMNELSLSAAGAIARWEPGAAIGRVQSSRAWALIDMGDDALAAIEARALGTALPAALADCEAGLAPCPAATVNKRLGALLTLTAGVGMQEGDRTEWLVAAIDALKGVPLDLLDRGVRAARPIADHPSKIVPLILAEIKGPWRERLQRRGRVRKLAALADAPREDPSPIAQHRVAPAEVDKLNGLMRQFGLATRYRPDGGQFQLAPGDPDPAPAHETALTDAP